MPLWLCETCGAEFPEDGSGDAMGKALAHTANTSKAGDKHRIRGLVDEATGEVLVPGLSARVAKQEGYVHGKEGQSRKDRERSQKSASDQDVFPGDRSGGGGEGGKQPKRARPRLDREKQQERIGKATSIRIHGREFVYPGEANAPRGQMPTPVRGVMEGWNLVFPAPMFGLFSLAQQIITDDKGNDYEWSPEGVSNFVWDCVRGYVEFFIPPLLARASEGTMNEQSAKRIIQRMAALDPEEIVAAAKSAVEEDGIIG